MTDEAPLGRAVFRPVRGANALEQSVARILQTIRLGVVAPGEALPAERDLATALAVSRDTVREAIRELSAAGWVETRRGRYGGTFVRETAPGPERAPDVSDLEEVLGLRAVLEPGAARAAAIRTLSASDREALSGALDACADADMDDYRRHDSRLHLVIAETAGIPALAALIADNRARVTELLDAFPLLPGNVQHSSAQHERIVRGILAGRPDEAEEAMREHVDGSAELLRGFLS